MTLNASNKAISAVLGHIFALYVGVGVAKKNPQDVHLDVRFTMVIGLWTFPIILTLGR